MTSKLQALLLVLSTLPSVFYLDQQFDFIRIPLPSPAGYAHLIESSMLPRSCNRSGVFASNTRLRDAAERLFEGQILEPETVALDAEGNIYAVNKSNHLHLGHHKEQGYPQLINPLTALGDGRSLALEFDAHGNLIMATAGVGLTMLKQGKGQVTVLASKVSTDSAIDPGTPIAYAEDLSIARDGTIFFTDGSHIGPQPPTFDILRPVLLSMAGGKMSGRLLSYSPATRKVTVLRKGFWFANGCALAHDESYILVADTIAAQIVKFHLRGKQAGESEVILSGLPGHPDNIRTAKDGTFWVALSAPLMEKLFPLLPYKHVRALLAWLPVSLVEDKRGFGAIVQINGNGEVLQYLEDPNGSKLSHTTAVTEGNDGLYIGNFKHSWIGFLPYNKLSQT